MLQGASLEANRQRKVNGRYYTPEAVARPMVEWALDGGRGRVLDPSFGGCAFLYTALEELKARGARRASRLIYGVDSDVEARAYLGPLLAAGAGQGQFVTHDFLALDPNVFGGPFRAVVGNPPYVRHHLLSQPAKLQGAAAAREARVRISGRASYWAYFVLHAARFVAPGGRLAFLLPAAFLYADYADAVHAALRRLFGEMTVAIIGERAFHDAEETSVALLASGASRSCSGIRVGWSATAGNLSALCEDPTRQTQPVGGIDNEGQWLGPVIGTDVLSLYEQLRAEGRTTRLGDQARVRIGTVTGCNSFFTFSEAARKSRRIPRRWVRPIVTKSRDLNGLRHSADDQKRLLESDRPALLLDASSRARVPAGVARYLRAGRRRQLHKAFKCRTRDVWHRVPDFEPPDAFLQYMCGGRPRIVLNEARASCTNSLHRITWKPESSGIDPRWFALAMLTSLTRLSAELIGRKYGGGLLKLEPRDARRLLLPLPPKDEKCAVFEEADHLLRDGDEEGARSLADSALLAAHLGLTSQQIGSLFSAWNLLRELRVGNGCRATR